MNTKTWFMSSGNVQFSWEHTGMIRKLVNSVTSVVIGELYVASETGRKVM